MDTFAIILIIGYTLLALGFLAHLILTARRAKNANRVWVATIADTFVDDEEWSSSHR